VGVNDEVLERSETYAREQYDGKTGSFKGAGSAGVSLYSAGGSLGTMSDSVNTLAMEEDKTREIAKSAKDEKVRQEAEKKLARIDRAKSTRKAAERSVVGRLTDPSFVSGFGSNGGEEFLSYMLLAESLVVKGGEDWEKWDRSMTNNLNRVQNADGSWTGHHCITGRTFVTSAALLVLTADRAPVPIAAKLKRG
jgi:hypothetical protein